jgi:hypothetical protein
MSTATPSWEQNAWNNHDILTPHGKRKLKKHSKQVGLIWAGVLAAIGAIYGPSACDSKNYDAPNQQPPTENPAYHNNGQELTLSRLLAAANMFNAWHNSLASDSFNNLYDQIDRTLDKKISLFSEEQNAHLNRGTNGKDSYHAYVGINEKWKTKEIFVSWHMPEPTPAEKINGAVATHKVWFVYYPGQNSIQRTDYHSDGTISGPVANSYDDLIAALRSFEGLVN